jgi:FtsH-binding integral membrane protein
MSSLLPDWGRPGTFFFCIFVLLLIIGFIVAFFGKNPAYGIAITMAGFTIFVTVLNFQLMPENIARMDDLKKRMIRIEDKLH